MSIRWRRLVRIALPVVVVFGLVGGVPAIREAALRTAGRALVVDEPVGSADVIVLPLWAGTGAAIDASDLVSSGIASRVAVVPGPPRPAEKELTRPGISHHAGTTYLVELLH